jgi:hypothetical protein
MHNLILLAVLATETACLRGREINSSVHKNNFKMMRWKEYVVRKRLSWSFIKL